MERSASQDFDDLIIRRRTLYPAELQRHQFHLKMGQLLFIRQPVERNYWKRKRFIWLSRGNRRKATAIALLLYNKNGEVVNLNLKKDLLFFRSRGIIISALLDMKEV